MGRGQPRGRRRLRSGRGRHLKEQWQEEGQQEREVVQVEPAAAAAAGLLELADGRGWLAVQAAKTGVVADRIELGFNDKPPTQEFEDPPAPNQMMLLSDMVLAWDDDFRKVLEEYAEDEELLGEDFGKAFKKLTELGCPFAKK